MGLLTCSARKQERHPRRDGVKSGDEGSEPRDRSPIRREELQWPDTERNSLVAIVAGIETEGLQTLSVGPASTPSERMGRRCVSRRQPQTRPARLRWWQTGRWCNNGPRLAAHATGGDSARGGLAVGGPPERQIRGVTDSPVPTAATGARSSADSPTSPPVQEPADPEPQAPGPARDHSAAHHLPFARVDARRGADPPGTS